MRLTFLRALVFCGCLVSAAAFAEPSAPNLASIPAAVLPDAKTLADWARSAALHEATPGSQPEREIDHFAADNGIPSIVATKMLALVARPDLNDEGRRMLLINAIYDYRYLVTIFEAANDPHSPMAPILSLLDRGEFDAADRQLALISQKISALQQDDRRLSASARYRLLGWADTLRVKVAMIRMDNHTADVVLGQLGDIAVNPDLRAQCALYQATARRALYTAYHDPAALTATVAGWEKAAADYRPLSAEIWAFAEDGLASALDLEFQATRQPSTLKAEVQALDAALSVHTPRHDAPDWVRDTMARQAALKKLSVK